MRAARLMQDHEVEFNILTTVHAANAKQPVEVYRFMRDVVKTPFVQFIRIVERDNDTGYQEGADLNLALRPREDHREGAVGLFAAQIPPIPLVGTQDTEEVAQNPNLSLQQTLSVYVGN